jgi:hypothetical protein
MLEYDSSTIQGKKKGEERLISQTDHDAARGRREVHKQ